MSYGQLDTNSSHLGESVPTHSPRPSIHRCNALLPGHVLLINESEISPTEKRHTVDILKSENLLIF